MSAWPTQTPSWTPSDSAHPGQVDANLAQALRRMSLNTAEELGYDPLAPFTHHDPPASRDRPMAADLTPTGRPG